MQYRLKKNRGPYRINQYRPRTDTKPSTNHSRGHRLLIKLLSSSVQQCRPDAGLPLQRMTMLVTHKKTNLSIRQRPVVDIDFVYCAIVVSPAFLRVCTYSEIVSLNLYQSYMSHSDT